MFKSERFLKVAGILLMMAGAVVQLLSNLLSNAKLDNLVKQRVAEYMAGAAA